jgi:small subunit ribosomal protein S16
MQRTGRKGHAMFRVVVQESRVTPTSGKVVALLGSYDPHAKTTTLDKVKAEKFLSNGAQPSERAASLLQSEGVKLPDWVIVNSSKARKLRNPEKLRKHQPKEEPQAETPVAEEAPAEAEAPAADAAEEKEA